MTIHLKTVNFKLTSTVETYVTEKISSLDKFISEEILAQGPDTVVAYVELKLTTRHHQKGEIFGAVADIKFPHAMIHAESSAVDIHTAIDRVRDELSTELKKYKEKKESVFKKGARAIKQLFRKAQQ